MISEGVETKEEAKMREKQQRNTRAKERGKRWNIGAPYGSPCSWPAAHGGCTLEHKNIPEGLQILESTHQSRLFLTATAVHGQISGAGEV